MFHIISIIISVFVMVVVLLLGISYGDKIDAINQRTVDRKEEDNLFDITFDFAKFVALLQFTLLTAINIMTKKTYVNLVAGVLLSLIAIVTIVVMMMVKLSTSTSKVAARTYFSIVAGLFMGSITTFIIIVINIIQTL